MRHLLPLLLLLGGCGGCASVPSHDDLRATTLRLEFTQGLCSATAIGPDLILSAKHCFDQQLKTIDGQPVRVVESHTESRDRIVVKVAGIRFKHWAKRGPIPSQGDRVRWWGNPLGEKDLYREGYVARAWTDHLVIVAVVCPGDSGAGIFLDDGRVVGVVSAMTNKNACAFGLSL